MAKIKCNKCDADTNYTTASQPKNRPRSIVPTGCGEETRIHLCSTCWEKLDATNVLGRG